MPEEVCNVDDRANELITSLTAGVEVPDLPVVDLNDELFKFPGDENNQLFMVVERLTNEDLTTQSLTGTGTFDVLMNGFKVHLKEEYEKNRITGSEYTKAYIELTQGAMQNATQYLLGREQAYWVAQNAQIQASISLVALEAAKSEYITSRYNALNAEATYAKTKMEISNLSSDFCMKEYQLANILPEQLAMLKEQVETQRSQTMDTRRDTTNVVGSVGKQKDLYSQQITSYQRDSEVRAAKMFTDAWITQKTIDEGLLAPDGFTNTSVDLVLDTIMTNNNFVAP